ncbi:alpha/beta-hydrolase [Ramaria rubella]|nr:alpha/beta-hydrolase [Ramaria rubella]
MSQYSHLSTPDKEWLEVSASFPAEPEEPLPLDILRRNLSKLVKINKERLDYPKSGMRVSDLSIPVQGASIVIRTYIPESNDDGSLFPVLVWFHGGGFRRGDVELDDTLMRLICKTSQISCVNVDYRLAPEHPFPIPVQDSYEAVKWVVVNASSLSADLAKGFLVGGASSGGNIATVICLKARDDPLLQGKLTGQILQIPVLCPTDTYPEKWKEELLSMSQNSDAPMLNRKAMAQIFADYRPPDSTSPDVSPLLASSLRGLPPAYLQICGLDPLRDEAFLYGKLLRESGVPTKVAVYPGLPHAFWYPAPLISGAKMYRMDTVEGIKWLIETKTVR